MAQKSRRDFIRASSLLVAGGAVTGPLGIARSAHAAGSDQLRVGLVGCGKSGKDAVAHLLHLGGAIQLVALADVFGDQIQAAYRQLKGRHGQRADVARAGRFAGLDGYRHLLGAELDLVVLATPPGFRPVHFEAVVAAGKHVFMEMPLAVDAVGVRRVLRAAEVAQKRGLCVAVNLPHRHEPAYQETIAQLRSGRVGAPVAVRVYRNAGELRPRTRVAGQSELEHQLRNWPFFTWLSGDRIVERHVTNLDVANWLVGGFPNTARSQGGQTAADRSALPQQTWDQFFCEFTYPQGARLYSQCRQARNCWNNVSEHVHLTHGSADISGGKIYDAAGQRIWQTKTPRRGAALQYENLIAAIRQGSPSSEAAVAAKSTLTAILGRQAAYAGRRSPGRTCSVPRMRWPTPPVCDRSPMRLPSCLTSRDGTRAPGVNAPTAAIGRSVAAHRAGVFRTVRTGPG